MGGRLTSPYAVSIRPRYPLQGNVVSAVLSTISQIYFCRIFFTLAVVVVAVLAL